MQTALKLTTNILPSKRIVVTAPELPDSGEVELIVVLPEKIPVATPTGQGKTPGVWDYIQSLPPVQRSPEEWPAIERELQKEKDSWER